MADEGDEQAEPLYGVALTDIPVEDRARAKALRRRILMIALIVALVAAIAAAVTVFAVRGESRSTPASIHAEATAWCAFAGHGRSSVSIFQSAR
jgi:hypothetical protein